MSHSLLVHARAGRSTFHSQSFKTEIAYYQCKLLTELLLILSPGAELGKPMNKSKACGNATLL